MCVLFCVGPPMMSLVFLVFMVMNRPGAGHFSVVEVFSLHILHQRYSYQLD